MRRYGPDTNPWLPRLLDADDEAERALIRARLGYTAPPTLVQLPAVEDTDRLVSEVRRVA